MDIKLEYLFQSVEFVTGINRVKLTAQTRAREVVDARRIYCSLAREYLSETVQNIGNAINLHHSSVIHMCSSHEDLYDLNKEYRENFLKVKEHFLSESMEVGFLESSILESEELIRQLRNEIKWKRKKLISMKNESSKQQCE